MTADAPSRTGTAELTWTDGKIELPLVAGTDGDAGIDISSLRAQTGLITLDAGYGSTGACTSAITFLDGEAGVLRYRGYPIEQLAEKSTFLEVAYLLIWGELPTREQLDRFVTEVTHHTLIREEMRHFFDSFPQQAHPQAEEALRQLDVEWVVRTEDDLLREPGTVLRTDPPPGFAIEQPVVTLVIATEFVPPEGFPTGFPPPGG